MRLLKTTLITILFLNFLYGFDSEECGVEEDIMFTILMVEQSPQRELYYPYIIRSNYMSDNDTISYYLETLGNEKISKYVYDCKNQKQCVESMKLLSSMNLTNFDLGAFQVNYKWHGGFPLESFFDFDLEYLIACKLIEQNMQGDEESMKNLSFYHSRTKEHNEKYQKLFLEKYQKLLEFKKSLKE